MTNKYKYLLSCLLICLFVDTGSVQAENFSVSPLLIDLETEARENFTKTITLNSLHDTHMRLYVSVNEIEIDDDSKIKAFIPASMSDRTTSITSWVEISRARIDLQPGDVREIPLTVRINPNAAPGIYHAFIGFGRGSNRDEAEKQVLEGKATGVVLRVNIDEKLNEQLRLVTFSTDRFTLDEEGGNLTYKLENVGDLPLTPRGSVFLYDSRGRELKEIEVNKEAREIKPGEVVEFNENLPFMTHLGKTKAFLDLQYGQTNLASINDTNYYYSLPWYYLLIIVVLLFVVLLTVILLLRRGVTREVHHDGVHELPLYVRDGSDRDECEHDINLKQTKL